MYLSKNNDVNRLDQGKDSISGTKALFGLVPEIIRRAKRALTSESAAGADENER